MKRFDVNPKPMCYQRSFLEQCWSEFLSENKVSETEVNPDEFIRATYAKAMAHRQPRYSAMAKWGITVTADEIAAATSSTAFEALIASRLPA